MLHEYFKFNLHLVNKKIINVQGKEFAKGELLDEEYGTEGNVLTDIKNDIENIDYQNNTKIEIEIIKIEDNLGIINDLVQQKRCKNATEELKNHLFKYLDDLAEIFDKIDGMQPDEFKEFQLYKKKTDYSWIECLNNKNY